MFGDKNGQQKAPPRGGGQWPASHPHPVADGRRRPRAERGLDQVECEVGGELNVGSKLVIGKQGVVNANVQTADALISRSNIPTCSSTSCNERRVLIPHPSCRRLNRASADDLLDPREPQVDLREDAGADLVVRQFPDQIHCVLELGNDGIANSTIRAGALSSPPLAAYYRNHLLD